MKYTQGNDGEEWCFEPPASRGLVWARPGKAPGPPRKPQAEIPWRES